MHPQRKNNKNQPVDPPIPAPVVLETLIKFTDLKLASVFKIFKTTLIATQFMIKRRVVNQEFTLTDFLNNPALGLLDRYFEPPPPNPPKLQGVYWRDINKQSCEYIVPYEIVVATVHDLIINTHELFIATRRRLTVENPIYLDKKGPNPTRESKDITLDRISVRLANEESKLLDATSDLISALATEFAPYKVDLKKFQELYKHGCKLSTECERLKASTHPLILAEIGDLLDITRGHESYNIDFDKYRLGSFCYLHLSEEGSYLVSLDEMHTLIGFYQTFYDSHRAIQSAIELVKRTSNRLNDRIAAYSAASAASASSSSTAAPLLMSAPSCYDEPIDEQPVPKLPKRWQLPSKETLSPAPQEPTQDLTFFGQQLIDSVQEVRNSKVPRFFVHVDKTALQAQGEIDYSLFKLDEFAFAAAQGDTGLKRLTDMTTKVTVNEKTIEVPVYCELKHLRSGSHARIGFVSLPADQKDSRTLLLVGCLYFPQGLPEGAKEKQDFIKRMADRVTILDLPVEKPKQGASTRPI